MTTLRDIWEETSFELDNLQANPECVQQERTGLKSRRVPEWQLSYDPRKIDLNIDRHITNAPRVAVIREEGTNGDREMIASFYMVGFEVADVTVTDLMNESISLDQMRGLVFPGGFSYADVLGSARGWTATLQYNPKVQSQLKRFKQRADTFSLGVCNGCQLMALLGWVGSKDDDNDTQGTILSQNISGRFECRFNSVKIPEHSQAIMFKDMGGSVLGVWSAHGEGRFMFENSLVKQRVRENDCVSMYFVDDDNNPTTRYPMNPNGSEEGIAAISSIDGRHLAMMPHPERATLTWQWPYIPPSLDYIRESRASPWAKMFENAYHWAINS